MRLISCVYCGSTSRARAAGFMFAVSRSISSESSHGKSSVTPNWTCPSGSTETPNHCAARSLYLRLAQWVSSTANASEDSVGLQWKLIPPGGVLDASVTSCRFPSNRAFRVMANQWQWQNIAYNEERGGKRRFSFLPPILALRRVCCLINQVDKIFRGRPRPLGT